MCKVRGPADLETDTRVVGGSGSKDMRNQKGKKTESPVGILKSSMNMKPDLSDSSFQEKICQGISGQPHAHLCLFSSLNLCVLCFTDIRLLPAPST